MGDTSYCPTNSSPVNGCRKVEDNSTPSLANMPTTSLTDLPFANSLLGSVAAQHTLNPSDKIFDTAGDAIVSSRSKSYHSTFEPLGEPVLSRQKYQCSKTLLNPSQITRRLLAPAY